MSISNANIVATEWVSSHGPALASAARRAGLELHELIAPAWEAAHKRASRAEPLNDNEIIGAALYENRQAEPTQRGHRGHSVAVDVETIQECARFADQGDPLGWIVAVEEVQAVVACSGWHAIALGDAMNSPLTQTRNQDEATHHVMSKRTQRRRRAVVRESGQLEMAGFGW